MALDARRTFVAFDGTAGDGEPVGPIAVLGAGGIVADDGVCAPAENFAGPGQGRKFPALAGAGLVPSVNPVAVWRIGDLGIVALPAEVTTQMGRRIRNSLAAGDRGAFDRVALAGLANGYVSYTATPEEYDHCGYEGSFTLFGRRQGARWADVAGAALAALIDGLPVEGAAEPPPSGLGTPNAAPVDSTPGAGQVVAQPAPEVRRHGRATFRWNGGDPAIDAPRGRTFVSLERMDGGAWQAVGSEDSEYDTTALGADGVWTETWQFATCDPLGSYRFRVTGVADSGRRAGPVRGGLRAVPAAPHAAARPGRPGGRGRPGERHGDLSGPGQRRAAGPAAPGALRARPP